MSVPMSEMAPWLITLGLAVLLLVQGVLSRRRMSSLEARMKDRYDTMGRELHAATSGSLGVGQRVVQAEREIHELRGLLDEMRQNDPLRISYDEASRLVELGADVEDLMNTCGISRPEAELVSALKKKQAA
jgi:hypothetical protein